MRDLCKKCGKRPVAINYYKNNRPYYRSKCDHCTKNRNKEKPMWLNTGFKMTTNCDRCGFSSKYKEQFSVFYIDGDLTNNKFNNLKTVCANCQRILHLLKLPWKQGDLKPDNISFKPNLK